MPGSAGIPELPALDDWRTLYRSIAKTQRRRSGCRSQTAVVGAGGWFRRGDSEFVDLVLCHAGRSPLVGRYVGRADPELGDGRPGHRRRGGNESRTRGHVGRLDDLGGCRRRVDVDSARRDPLPALTDFVRWRGPEVRQMISSLAFMLSTENLQGQASRLLVTTAQHEHEETQWIPTTPTRRTSRAARGGQGSTTHRRRPTPWWQLTHRPPQLTHHPVGRAELTSTPGQPTAAIEAAPVEPSDTRQRRAAGGRDRNPRTPTAAGFAVQSPFTAAAVVVSAAASGTVVHVVDDHSGHQSAAPAASVTKTNATTATPARHGLADGLAAGSSGRLRRQDRARQDRAFGRAHQRHDHRRARVVAAASAASAVSRRPGAGTGIIISAERTGRHERARG